MSKLTSKTVSFYTRAKSDVPEQVILYLPLHRFQIDLSAALWKSFFSFLVHLDTPALVTKVYSHFCCTKISFLLAST